MTRLAIAFGILAILTFADGNVSAATWAFEPDNYFNNASVYPQIPNDNVSNYYQTLPYGPTATEDGFIWLKTGSGSPSLFSGNTLTVAAYYKNISGGWTFEETENADCSSYPGQFVAGSPINVSSLVSSGGDGRYVTDPNLAIVGSETIPTTDLGGSLVLWNQTQFYLQTWTGAYSSYAAAYAASARGVSGVYVAQTVPFLVDLGPGGTQPFDYVNEFMYMPAIVLAHGLDGDANLDGKVDINDLTIVLAHYGQTAGVSWATGDFNNDGKVDINDLTIVLANYGQTAGASAAGNLSAAPEPSTLLLTAAGLLALVACAWRKRK